jgi:protein-L-isoaspartate O-methyltransferase
MDQQTLKHIAAQLRKPEGEGATRVGEKMNDGNRFINLRAIRRLEVKPGDNILEIGMGNGFFVESVLSVAPTVRYTGCDYSPEMVQQATGLNQAAVASGQARFLTAEAGRHSAHRSPAQSHHAALPFCFLWVPAVRCG